MAVGTALLPFPSGGLNARDPLDAMPSTDAWELTNILPRGGYGEPVGDAVIFHDNQGSNDPAKTIINAPYRDTGEKVFTVYGGKIIYILTSTTETELRTGQTEDAWQYAFINNTLVMVNGADQPVQISSTPTLSDATYTTISDDAKLIDVTVFKDRLYFIEKDTTKMWYGATGATTGALTAFDLASVLQKGGTLTWIGSWTQGTGTGIQDFLIIMSSQGEMLIYEGDDPATTWNIAGRFFVGKPLSIRGKKNIGADLWFLTREGMLSAADVLNNHGVAGKYRALTDKIQNLYRTYFNTYGAAVGWEIFHYPRGNLVLINLPPTVNLDSVGGYGLQLAMNTETGAWCQIQRMYPAWCWALWSDFALYGGRTSTAKAFNPAGAASAGGGTYYGTCYWAYNDLGARGVDKNVTMMRPALSDFTDFNSGSGSITVSFGVYGELRSGDGLGTTSLTWLASAGTLNRWIGAAAYSKLISPILQITVSSCTFHVNSMQLMFETSGEPF